MLKCKLTRIIILIRRKIVYCFIMLLINLLKIELISILIELIFNAKDCQQFGESLELFYVVQSIILYQLMRLGKQITSTEEGLERASSIFLLKRAGSSSNGPFVQVDFSPQSAPTPTPSPNPQPEKLYRRYPVLNQDGNFFTPTFYLEQDEPRLKKNLQSYLNLHEERGKEALQQKEEIYVPKPSKANSFCSICKTNIDDYLTHLNTPKHQQLLRSAEFCQDIAQLCGRYSQHTKKIVKSPKQQTKRGRKCKTVKEDLCEANYTTSSTVNIQEYSLQKAMQAC